MISYTEACQQVGHDRSAKCPFEDKVRWFAYKAGQVMECADQASAKAISSNVERLLVANPEKEEWWINYRFKEMKASEIFHQALREEYSDLSDEVYNICYSEAYDEGHSNGYDEVANCMIRYTFFAAKIIGAVQK